MSEYSFPYFPCCQEVCLILPWLKFLSFFLNSNRNCDFIRECNLYMRILLNRISASQLNFSLAGPLERPTTACCRWPGPPTFPPCPSCRRRVVWPWCRKTSCSRGSMVLCPDWFSPACGRSKMRQSASGLSCLSLMLVIITTVSKALLLKKPWVHMRGSGILDAHVQK